MDFIHVKGIEADCIIGDLDWERTTKQPIRCDIAVATDIAKVCASDNLKDAIDYVAIGACVVETLTSTKHQMLETLAEDIAQNLLKTFPTPEVQLTVHKQAHFEHAAGVAISLTRSTQDVAGEHRNLPM